MKERIHSDDKWSQKAMNDNVLTHSGHSISSSGMKVVINQNAVQYITMKSLVFSPMNILPFRKLIKCSAMTAITLMTVILPWDNPLGNDTLQIMAQHRQFSLPSWTVRALAQKYAPTYGAIQLSDENILDSYFNLIKQNANSYRSSNDSSAQIQSLAITAEDIIAKDITTLFKENEIGKYFLGDIFPPILFKFENPPYVLVVSPRNRIEIQMTKLLKQNMDLWEIELLEKTGADQNLSVFVTRVGGIATFPSFITPPHNRSQAIRLVIHEWIHHYLFFQPLGRNYWSSPEMTTLNESTADLISDEIAGTIEPAAGATRLTKATGQVNYNQINVTRILRQTRLKSEQLLAESRIEEAESFMEKQRQFLNENGVTIRKLNQAFFAFNGSYAMHPESVSPIGRQLSMIRNESTSIAEFLEKIQRIDSIENFNQLAATNSP